MRSRFNVAEDWAQLGSDEKAIYSCSSVDRFFRLCAIYVPRYHDKFFAAKNAFKGVMGKSEIPTERSRAAGIQRLQLYDIMKEYAELRDRGLDRDEAVALIFGGSQDEDPDKEFDDV